MCRGESIKHIDIDKWTTDTAKVWILAVLLVNS